MSMPAHQPGVNELLFDLEEAKRRANRAEYHQHIAEDNANALQRDVKDLQATIKSLEAELRQAKAAFQAEYKARRELQERFLHPSQPFTREHPLSYTCKCGGVELLREDAVIETSAPEVGQPPMSHSVKECVPAEDWNLPAEENQDVRCSCGAVEMPKDSSFTYVELGNFRRHSRRGCEDPRTF